jgi:NADH-quinone oxidoreductase subunit N
MIAIPSIHYLAITPFLIVAGAALVLLVATAMRTERLTRGRATGFALVAALAAIVVGVINWFQLDHHSASTTLAGAVVLDRFSVAMNLSVLGSLTLALLVDFDAAGVSKRRGGEFQMLSLLTASGALLMGQANDFIITFIGLEIMSLALYVMVAAGGRGTRRHEAAMKYFLLGGFAAAIFIYGAALLYGATGSTNFSTIEMFLSLNSPLHLGLLLAGATLVMVALSFKVKLVPFHFWAPDVYEAASRPVTGFMAAVVWGGAYAAFLRIVDSALGTQLNNLRPILLLLVVVSLVAGALFTITQTEANRLLAYSSIVHSGFIALALSTGTARGVAAAVFYVIIYSPTALATFAVISLYGEGIVDVARFRGLARSNPVLGFAMAVLLLSQLGIPLTVGFVAKFNALSAGIDGGATWVAVVAMLSAATVAVAYLRWATALYSDEGSGSVLVVPLATRIVVGVGAVMTLVEGVDPGWLSSVATHATLIFLP